MELAQVSEVLTLLRVRKDGWPFEDFMAYVDAKKRAVGISSDAQLARLADIPSSILSRWRSGQNQPAHDNLRKLAAALGVPPVTLWVLAGRAAEEEMDLSGTVDLTVLPSEVHELIDLYGDDDLTDDDRDYLRRTLTQLVAGVRTDIATRAVTPINRRRRGVA